jgi:hypothetical protein
MKRLLSQKITLFLGSLLLLGLVSCQTDEVCEEGASNPLRIGFYLPLIENGSPQAYTADSLTVYGVGRPDSLIYNNTKTVRTIEVPVDPTSGRTGFVLIFPNNIIDTLWVDCTHHLTFISAECGFRMRPEIMQVVHTTNRISTYQLTQKLVTQSFEEHIKILLYPDFDN